MPATHGATACTAIDPRYTCEIARDPVAVAAAHDLVRKVYRERLALATTARSCAVDAARRILLVRRAGEPVATLMLRAQRFAPDAPRTPLEAEQRYDLEGLGPASDALAEVSRMAVRPRNPGAARALYRFAIEVSEAAGISHWIGLVEAGSAAASDAAIVHRVLAVHGLVHTPLPLRPRGPSQLFTDECEAPKRAFGDRHVGRIPPPRRVKSFGRLFAARAVSVPTMHPAYARLVVPVLASVDAFRAYWVG